MNSTIINHYSNDDVEFADKNNDDVDDDVSFTVAGDGGAKRAEGYLLFYPSCAAAGRV